MLINVSDRNQTFILSCAIRITYTLYLYRGNINSNRYVAVSYFSWIPTPLIPACDVKILALKPKIIGSHIWQKEKVRFEICGTTWSVHCTLWKGVLGVRFQISPLLGWGWRTFLFDWGAVLEKDVLHMCWEKQHMATTPRKNNSSKYILFFRW